MGHSRRLHGFLHRHGLSTILAAIVAGLFLWYRASDPSTHAGSFAGNALADWSGSLVFILCTKYLYEIGSEESRRPPTYLHERVGWFLYKHSLSIVLAITTVGWLMLFARMNPDGKAGTVVGNIASEWTQILGLVIITKYFRESGAKAG